MKNQKMLKKEWLVILLLSLITQAVFAQSIQVQGSITDENGEAMIGVRDIKWRNYRHKW